MPKDIQVLGARTIGICGNISTERERRGLISPLCRRHFDIDGLLINTHGDYPRSMEALAVQEKVPFIDLCGRSAVAFKEVGDAKSREWLTWLRPDEHPNLRSQLGYSAIQTTMINIHLTNHELKKP